MYSEMKGYYRLYKFRRCDDPKDIGWRKWDKIIGGKEKWIHYDLEICE